MNFTVGHILKTRVAIVAAALICLVVTATSCRTIKEVQYETVTEYVHDTVREYVHDSINSTNIIHDSIDHYFERIIYVDTNGVVHEREIERLTQYFYERSEEYQAKEREYRERIEELESQLAESTQTVEVRKPLNWFQRTLVGLGVCFIIVIVVYAVRLYIKLKIKV